MACLGVCKRCRHRFPVTNFPHQNHIGCLAHGVFQRNLAVDGVSANLALVDDAALVGENIFNRIFDRQHMADLVLVAVIKHGSKRCALAGTSSAHHQNQSTLTHNQFTERLGGKTQTLQRRNRYGDVAQNRRVSATLTHDTDTVIADPRQSEGSIHFADLHQLFDLCVVQNFLEQYQAGISRHELLVDRHHVAVDLDQYRCVGGNENVRCILVRHQAQHTLHIAHRSHDSILHKELVPNHSGIILGVAAISSHGPMGLPSKSQNDVCPHGFIAAGLDGPAVCGISAARCRCLDVLFTMNVLRGVCNDRLRWYMDGKTTKPANLNRFIPAEEELACM